jgi:hypothetical protein
MRWEPERGQRLDGNEYAIGAINNISAYVLDK